MAVAALVAAAVAGCGGANATDARVTRTVTRAFAAVADGDGATVCDLTTPAGRAQLAAAGAAGGGGGGGCAAVVGRVSGELAPETKLALRDVHIAHVTVRGATATIAARDISARRGSLAGFLDPDSAPTVLTRGRDGSWRISG
jgi:hypothetical protein